MIMALRKLLRETNLSSKALFFFPEDNMTGIAPTKIILQKIMLLLEELLLLTGKGKEWKLNRRIKW